MLETYRRKRDFSKTPEPQGHLKKSAGKALSFFVQKHAASHLHYDFRLEHKGVLVSWAVPKGPSLDPADKRLAIQVEDHPLEYGTFEGVIPPKQYGAGTVMLWDRGTWQPLGDPARGLREGKLKFTLEGEKLRGAWTLVKSRATRFGENAWLLIKENDDFVATAAVVDTAPRSVASGRSLPEIAGSDAEGLHLTHPDKVLFPESGLTKLDLANYYAAVGPWIVPHLKGRPLSLVRCPDGWKKGCFYQKHATGTLHESIDEVSVRLNDGPAKFLMASSATAVVAMLQMGAVEFHPWGSSARRLDRPDHITFDFDPDDKVGWKELVAGARILKSVLDELELESFVKTTGGKGLHVVLPIDATRSWEEIKGFSKAIAESLAFTFPERFTARLAKTSRKGKVFIDYLRNAEGATAVAPYSLRARSGAPVAMPLAWGELGGRDVRLAHFNAKNVPALLARRKDPWADFFTVRQAITVSRMKKVGFAP